MVFGIVPTTQLADAGAPFSDAVNGMSGGTWAGNLMSIAVIISGFGALDGQANRRDHLVESARESRGGVLAEVMIGIALSLLWLVAVTTPSRYASS